MKLCMMSYTLGRRPDLFSVHGMMALTKELGLTGIDFVTLHDTPAEELRRMADDIGVTVACHTFFADLSMPDAKERQPGIEAIKRGIDAAVTLGTHTIMLPTPGRADQTRDDTRAHIIAGLQEVAEFAQQAGITLTVENFPGARSPFITAADVLQAVREVPGMKITYDNGNASTGEDPAASFVACAEHVVHAHFKDWHYMPDGEGMEGLDGRWRRPGLIGEGILDQRGCLKAMHDAGYRGFINIEYEGDAYTPADATRMAVTYLRQQMAEMGISEF